MVGDIDDSGRLPGTAAGLGQTRVCGGALRACANRERCGGTDEVGHGRRQVEGIGHVGRREVIHLVVGAVTNSRNQYR